MVSSQGVFNNQTPSISSTSSTSSTTTSTATSTATSNGTDDLVTIAKQFRNTPQQIKLVRWLQASTGADKQAQFAFLWRNQQQGGAIDFAQVFQSYKGFAHQDDALRWLQQNSQPKTFQGFAKMWQTNVPGSVPGSVQESVQESVPGGVLGKREAIRLNIPFFAQTDNRIDPDRTCNTSSCAMVAKYLGAKIAGDDDYFKIVSKYGDTTDHTAQTRALAEIGIQSTWHTTLGYASLDESLEKNLPIVIAIYHRGTLTAPTGGHILVVVGKTVDNNYIFNDPFGSLLDPGGAYTGNVTNGKGVIYSRKILDRRWLLDGASNGWGRLFYGNSVNT